MASGGIVVLVEGLAFGNDGVVESIAVPGMIK